MRALIFSLIITILLAVMGIGWGINQWYQLAHTQETNQSPLEHAWSDDIQAYISLTQNIAHILDSTQNTTTDLPADYHTNKIEQSQHSNDSNNQEQQAFIAQWNTSSANHISLHSKNQFLIPDALTEKFYQSEPLILNTEGIISINQYLPHTQNVLTLVASAVVPQINNRNTQLLFTLLFYIGVIAIILIWLYPLIIRLQALNQSARKFGQGDLSARVTTKKWSYIRHLEAAFNQMAMRIQTLIDDNKLLSRAVSHDLKTPLARLRFGLDTFADTQDPVQKEHYYERLNNDFDNMEALINTLLDYAKLDENNIALKYEPVDLNQLTSNIIHDHKITAQTKGVEITFIAKGNTTILADKPYIAMQINNLITNAINHTKRKIHITINPSITGSPPLSISHLTWQIEDDGQGFEAGDHQRLLQPFQKGNNDSQVNQGHGMGLAICHKISLWFKGDITLGQSSTLKGAQIALKYPIK